MSAKKKDQKMNPEDNLNFLKIQREVAEKRSHQQRQQDFNEIYHSQNGADIQVQASRCLDCGNPYCEWRCPLHNYIPNWLSFAANGEFEKSAVLMHETNPLPEICGRVCPQDRLCEQACTLNTGFGAITIGAIEKNITDLALDANWRPDLSKLTATGKTVAVVGAGPAGLGCAELLTRNGVKVIVFDRYPEIGGLLTFGIPEFKLEKSVLRKRRRFLEDIGIEFQLNTEIGKTITIEQLQQQHDAVFLGMGTYTPIDGSLPGLDTKGVVKALDYLIGNINHQQSYAMEQFPHFDMKDQHVLVVGGGDTAMDCVRSAVRQKAASVRCVYRRTEKEMPGSKQEVQNAKEEGVEFIFQHQPIAIESSHGTMTAVCFKITGDGEDAGEAVLIEGNRLIIAFGFTASPAKWLDQAGVEINEKGLIKTLESNDTTLPYSQKTSKAGIYAGGDMVRGADLVVTAIAEGRQAAREILQDLTSKN